MKVHVIGSPSYVGGANTELWHTLLLWREHGCQVALTPTWQADEHWTARCQSIGCVVQPATISTFAAEPGVPLIAFCNSQFWGVIKKVDRLQCPTVWVPCMNFLTDREMRRYESGVLPSAVVCQSAYQRSQIEPQLLEYGIAGDRIERIRGAFDVSSIAFAPKATGPEFVVGRISRADPAKFRPDLWDVLERARARIDRPLKARILGWKPGLAKRLGPPPAWAEVYEPGSVNAIEFLRSLDCLYQSGTTAENWPRVGLEAMAAGVPIVADDRGGWPELFDGGRLGYLVATPEAAVKAICRVATEPQGTAVELARQEVERSLGSNGELWCQWRRLFERIINVT